MEGTFAYSTDTQTRKGERVTFKDNHGHVYSKKIEETEPLREFTKKEKKKLLKKPLEKIYHDPILDGQYKPIEYTQEEINSFHDALSGGPVLDLLKTRREYIVNRPSQNEGFGSEGIDAEPDGLPEATLFDPESSVVPGGSTLDPYYLMRGRFKILLKGHKYTHEVNTRLLPMMYLPFKDRKILSLDDIRRELKIAGVHCVRELTISQNRLLLESRFVIVEPTQDEEDRQTAKAKRDELMNVTLDILDSLIEDYLRLNCVLVSAGGDKQYRFAMFFYSA